MWIERSEGNEEETNGRWIRLEAAKLAAIRATEARSRLEAGALKQQFQAMNDKLLLIDLYFRFVLDAFPETFHLYRSLNSPVRLLSPMALKEALLAGVPASQLSTRLIKQVALLKQDSRRFARMDVARLQSTPVDQLLSEVGLLKQQRTLNDEPP